MRGTRRIRRARWLAATLLVSCAWVAVVYHRHRERLDALRRDDVPRILDSRHPAVSTELLKLVGFFDNRQRSSFLHFRREKPDGVRRLCALGDSFTQGAEVDEAHDYPSLLHHQLARSDPGRFEVLNFGQAWFGFHQTYMVWDELARRYGCDVLLLGPGTFYPERDTTFNHAREANPYYLHARYVLDGSGLRRLEVIGETVEERFEEYQRLLPHWRYLRYDDVAPAAMRALLPAGWTADNPFYHRADKETEAYATYRRLLGRLAQDAPAVVLGASLRVTTLAPTTPGVTTFRPLLPRSFPYRAAGGHFGPIGNDLVARQYAAAVTGRRGSWLPVLRTRELEEDPPSGGPPPIPLHRYGSIAVEIDGAAVGHFVTGSSRDARKGSLRTLARNHVEALVLVATPGATPVTGSESPVDGCFLPLASPPRDGAPVELAGHGERTRIGRVRLWHPELAVGEIVLDRDFQRRRPVLVSTTGAGVFQLPDAPAARPGERTTEVRIEVGGEPVLAGVLPKLHSTRGPCFLLRANRTGLVPLEDRLASSGRVEIVARRPDAGDVRAAIARWEIDRLAPSR